METKNVSKEDGGMKKRNYKVVVPLFAGIFFMCVFAGFAGKGPYEPTWESLNKHNP